MSSSKPGSSSASKLKIVILVVALTSAAAGAIYLGNPGILTDAWNKIRQGMVELDTSQNIGQSATVTLPRVSIDLQVGTVLIELYPEQAPKAVAEFLSLIKSGYYGSDTFMEARPGLGLVIGRIGGSAKSFEFTDETNALTSRRGSVAVMKAAESPAYLNNIFIGYDAQPEMEQYYTIIGQVIEGIDDAERAKPGSRHKVGAVKVLNETNTNSSTITEAGW